MGLVYSISLGSLIYIWPEYRELWIFLQIIILPAIYYVGYEIILEKQRKNFNSAIEEIQEQIKVITEERDKLKQVSKSIK
jgi:hypothetical protein